MDLSPIPIWNWHPHGFIYLSARPFAASGAFRMSELAASGAALESFSPPQQPRRSVGKVAVERERETQWRRRRKRAYTLAPVLSHAMMLHRKKSWYDSLNRVTLKQYFNRNCITIQVQMNPNVNLWISWTMNILKVILFVLNVKLIYLK